MEEASAGLCTDAHTPQKTIGEVRTAATGRSSSPVSVAQRHLCSNEILGVSESQPQIQRRQSRGRLALFKMRRSGQRIQSGQLRRLLAQPAGQTIALRCRGRRGRSGGGRLGSCCCSLRVAQLLQHLLQQLCIVLHVDPQPHRLFAAQSKRRQQRCRMIIHPGNPRWRRRLVRHQRTIAQPS